MSCCPFVCISVWLLCAKRILTSRNKTLLSFRKDLGKHVDPAHLLYNPFIQVVCSETCKATIIGAPYPQGNLFKGDVFLVIHHPAISLKTKVSDQQTDRLNKNQKKHKFDGNSIVITKSLCFYATL